MRLQRNEGAEATEPGDNWTRWMRKKESTVNSGMTGKMVLPPVKDT